MVLWGGRAGFFAPPGCRGHLYDSTPLVAGLEGMSRCLIPEPWCRQQGRLAAAPHGLCTSASPPGPLRMSSPAGEPGRPYSGQLDSKRAKQNLGVRARPGTGAEPLQPVLAGPPRFSRTLIAGVVVSDRGGGTVAAGLGDWYLCQPRRIA